MVALDALKNIDLHDQSFDGLQFDFSSKQIVVRVGVYNDERSDYDYLELIFMGVEKIDITQLSIDDLSSLEIFSHEVFQASDNPAIKFSLLTGFGKPSVEFSFSFSDYRIRI